MSQVQSNPHVYVTNWMYFIYETCNPDSVIDQGIFCLSTLVDIYLGLTYVMISLNMVYGK